jgi:prepilin-type N-terminal cleavage/methylation domain-containing protein
MITHPQPHHHPAHSPRRGFTLIEIMVVVVILLLLLSIGVSLGPSVLGVGDEALTKTMLNQLAAVSEEYQARVGSTVNINLSNDYIYTKNSGTAGTGKLTITNYTAYITRSGERFIALTYKRGSKDGVGRMYASIAGEGLKDTATAVMEPDGTVASSIKKYDQSGGVNSEGLGFLEPVDGWGTRLVYYQPNHAYSGFLPKRSAPYWASAGPDGRFGNANPTVAVGSVSEKEAYNDSRDNIYSYDAN